MQKVNYPIIILTSPQSVTTDKLRNFIFYEHKLVVIYGYLHQ